MTKSDDPHDNMMPPRPDAQWEDYMDETTNPAPYGAWLFWTVLFVLIVWAVIILAIYLV